MQMVYLILTLAVILLWWKVLEYLTYDLILIYVVTQQTTNMLTYIGRPSKKQLKPHYNNRCYKLER
jgi:hypothetical protein